MSDTCLRERGSESRVDRAIKVSTAGAVLAVAGIAAVISYWHAYAVVREFGETGLTARLEPAMIDGLVYACSMVMLYAARHRRPVPTLARWLLALGIAATLAANMAQGWSHGAGGAVVAAWPAASLVGSYELLVWIIRTSSVIGPARVSAAGVPDRLAGQDQAADQPAAGPRATAAAQPLSAGAKGWPGRTGTVPAGRDCGPVADHGDRLPVSEVPSGADAAAVAAYRASVQAGKPLSERGLAGMFGRSRRWARNRIAEARAQEPQMAA